MAKVGAQRAAELTGKSKSTIQRAMNAGKLSFEVDANSRRLIDVSELERVFGIQPQGNDNSQKASASEDGSDNTIYAMEIELEKARHTVEVERLKMEVRMLQEQLDMAQQQIDDLKVQRDLWQKQAQQILITSQYSQKQSEERIAEMREREDARQRMAEAKRAPQAPLNNSARPQAAGQQTGTAQATQRIQQPAAPAQPAAATAAPASVQPAQSQGPVFRTVQTVNQNKAPQAAPSTTQKTSLFASLFGSKKVRQG